MLGIVLLWMVVYLSGILFCKISGEKETSQMWKHLIGFFFLIFCQGIFFFGGQMAGWSFGNTSMILSIFLLCVCCVSVFVCKKELGQLGEKVRQFKIKDIKNGRYYGLVFCLLAGLVFVVMTGTAVNRNDAMIETVQTTLLTDTMNRYHPFTKQELELGMIVSKKIITLPFWYSMLSVWTGLDVVTTVWGVGTLITIVCSLMAFGELGGLLFFRDFKKTWLLVVFMELLYLSGDYYAGSAGYRQLFYGYSGEIIVATVNIPCVLSILYRFFGPFLREDFPVEKESIRIWGMIVSLGLCVGSSFFISSFIWGILMIVISVGLFTVSGIGVRMTKRIKWKGEEKV